MRIHTLHTAPSSRRRTIRAACLVAAVLVAATSSAKSTRGKKAAEPLPPPEINRNASRFLLPENQPAYLDRMISRISMSKRTFDPFGRSQDPDAKPALVAKPDPARMRITSLSQNIPLQQIVSLLRVSTIIPGEKRFLIGGDSSFRVGDTMPLSYRGKSIKAQVVAVNASQIHFRDAESGETATLEMKLLPPGMQPGTQISETPGLFRNNQQAPINLDAP